MQSESFFVAKINDESKIGHAIAAQLLRKAVALKHCEIFFAARKHNISKTNYAFLNNCFKFRKAAKN